MAWRLEQFKAAIDAMLIEDTMAPLKQRHTARRILARLIEEHGAKELPYSTVPDYVRVHRAQIDVETGRRVEVFVPQGAGALGCRARSGLVIGGLLGGLAAAVPFGATPPTGLSTMYAVHANSFC